MTLEELGSYNPITIQCHDNPDADAIASGFALYSYYKKRGNSVSFIYSGRFPISKSNILLMIEKLGIPVSYRPAVVDGEIKGLLITVDCQYGCGNVTRFQAEKVAVIDHHQPEMLENDLCEIRPELGSCSTLCWKLLKDVGYEVTDTALGTALYYGLYTDTQQFSEISNPLDMDMRDTILCNKSLITLFRNSNISRDELETAGIALIRNIYNEKHRFAIVRSGPCDPNILGLISDFLLQVDGVDVCIVYNELPDGYKLSFRSCVKEVKANELAEYICDDIGSGGGHIDKAGGFISRAKYEEKFPCIHTESYLGDRMHSYFDDTEIIYTNVYNIDTTGMKKYQKKQFPIGYVIGTDIFPTDTIVDVRTLEGDVELRITDDLIIMIGVKGEIYPSYKEKFDRSYIVMGGSYSLDESPVKTIYVPKVTNRQTGEVVQIMDKAKKCMSSGNNPIYAKPLDHYVKLFTEWDDEAYMLGKPGDYIAVRTDDKHDIYIIEQDIMGITYAEID